MDEKFEHRGPEEAPLLTKKPSQYSIEGGNIFFGLEAEERSLGPMPETIWDDIFMSAADWPHWDGEWVACLALC